jgi:type 1 glutamine amidotransferase
MSNFMANVTTKMKIPCQQNSPFFRQPLSCASSLAGRALAFMFLALSLVGACAQDAGTALKPPLKVLLIASGCCHDYTNLAPFLRTNLDRLVNADIEVHFGLDDFANPKFADGYDAVIYDVCEEDTPDANLDNVMNSTRAGKPTVMIHCSIHAFRKSHKISEWEMLCGMRSKVHDRLEGFTVTKCDTDSPITASFPDNWTTAGDELYQTIAIDPKSHQLLRAKSPVDGRVHVVCWTCQYGQGRVFSTTLGHDMKTTATPEYLQLVANGLLWSCSKLTADGKPAPGYGPPHGQN